ncbi:MAG TPA: hypothetical protein VGM23_11970, partial [Armatimonadota bacterium]
MKEVAILWNTGPREGFVDVAFGRLSAISSPDSQIEGAHFSLTGDAPRLIITIDGENLGHGADPTMVTLRTAEHPFTFLLRDVDSAYPIYLPMYGTVVTGSDDQRSYAEIADGIRAKGQQTALQRIAAAPEESYAEASSHTRDMQPCPTWLGLSRDMRLFYLDYQPEGWSHQIRPHFHGVQLQWPEAGDKAVSYNFYIGRGLGCVYHLTRRLDDGVLPILHARLADGHITYQATS